MGLMCAKQPAKLAMIVLLALLLLLNYGVGNVHCSTVHENSVDLHSLLNFQRGITNDPKGALSTWNTSVHFCRWNGVTCSLTRPWRVTALNLTGQSLSGPISSSLGNLTFLNTLDLSNNNFIGPLPLLNHLQQLETLVLTGNLLHGTIPGALTNSSSLTYLSLSGNLLVGAIPPNIGFGSNLIVLDLSMNNLTGIIPPTLGNITTLKGLGFANNQLNGSIPDQIWELPNIVELLLGHNMLSGRIPHALSNKSSVQMLGLEYNRLGYALPPNIGDRLPNVQMLILNGNMFEGRIPTSLGNVSGLSRIDLSSNNFSGQVPSSFGKLLNLTWLNLEENKLEATDNQGWEFLDALGNCSFLEALSLAGNQLQGIIPNSIGNLSTNLQYLVFGGNNLSGIVPPSIGNLRGLIKLSLDKNNLTGTIEEWVGNLKNLQGLDLGVNNLIGSIPSSIGILTNLTILSLEKNKFEGLMLPTLGNLSGLLQLDLSFNNLQGSIPLEVSNLKQLTELRLSSNKLSGEIPDTLDRCKNLVDIHMDQNFLTGNIPMSFGNLMNLGKLNLSRNNLSGTIPTSLNDLQLLSELDLSYNHLYGEVPRNGVFANATAVSLDGNLGLCGGATDLHMPPCPAVFQRTKRQIKLVKILIPIFGFMSLILLVYFLLLEKKQPRRYLSLPYFGEHFHKVSYNDIAQATGNFSESNLIGRGSYGTVYRGKLKDTKMDVAVKVFDLEMQGAERSFMSECEALRSIQHRNLLPILTACSTVDNTGNVFKALIYEFMPNGSLDTWIHSREDDKAPKHLSLTQRISIGVNIADALDYIHNDCGRPTVHCDLKPSNILLDDDMNALLGDFGIARFYPGSWSTSTGPTSSVGVKGTIGYIAPEYGAGSHASTSGDVYSFGIVLLEMMTGKRPTDPMFKDGLDIINFVEGNFPHQISQVIDALLIQECKDDFDQAKMITENAAHHCLVSLLQVALSCTNPLPSERMDMKQTASKMHAIKTSYLGWKAKK